MTEPTETEIEAMAKVIGDKAVELARGKWEIEWPWLRDPDSNAAVDLRELARAALTAAAQVRERADRAAIYEDCAKLADQIAINAERRAHGHVAQSAAQEAAFNKMDGAQSVRDAIIERGKKNYLGATEPDSGPSVLGNEE